MARQIKIADDVYKRLKADADLHYRPIGKHIEFLMDASDVDVIENTPLPKNTEKKNLAGATPEVGDLFTSAEDASKVVTDSEKPCCKNETRPCQHWVWDTGSGEGYVNSLSGRKMEVE